MTGKLTRGVKVNTVPLVKQLYRINSNLLKFEFPVTLASSRLTVVESTLSSLMLQAVSMRVDPTNRVSLASV